MIVLPEYAFVPILVEALRFLQWLLQWPSWILHWLENLYRQRQLRRERRRHQVVE
jgi:hypothetical protein